MPPHRAGMRRLSPIFQSFLRSASSPSPLSVSLSVPGIAVRTHPLRCVLSRWLLLFCPSVVPVSGWKMPRLCRLSLNCHCRCQRSHTAVSPPRRFSVRQSGCARRHIRSLSGCWMRDNLSVLRRRTAIRVCRAESLRCVP